MEVFGIVTSLFSSLLPPDVAVSEARRCAGQMAAESSWAFLPEQERFLVRDAAPVRREELAAGRRRAHAALRVLGADVEVIGRGERGEPIWPNGVVGSITHCDGFVAAVVTHATRHIGLGIDAEPADELPPGVLGEIASQAEKVHVAALAQLHPSTPWDRLLFCAKEACYKTWFPCEKTWLGFEEADVRIDPLHGTFTVELSRHIQRSNFPRRVIGCWGSTGEFVGAAISIRAFRSSPVPVVGFESLNTSPREEHADH